jgi:hypothetical protein
MMISQVRLKLITTHISDKCINYTNDHIKRDKIGKYNKKVEQHTYFLNTIVSYLRNYNYDIEKANIIDEDKIHNMLQLCNRLLNTNYTI